MQNKYVRTLTVTNAADMKHNAEYLSENKNTIEDARLLGCCPLYTGRY
jgi:hypothetical protein